MNKVLDEDGRLNAAQVLFCVLHKDTTSFLSNCKHELHAADTYKQLL